MRRKPTPAEKVLWSLLRRKQLLVRVHRQVCMLGYIADFYCSTAKLVIEADGPIHDAAKDALRDSVFARHGILTLRFKNDIILACPNTVFNCILQMVYSRMD